MEKTMENTEEVVLRLAEDEVAQTGVLSFPGRRRLWEAMGPLEPRERGSGVPRALTGPLKKRAELALACAKKVSRIWCAFDGEDKRPQHLLKRTRAYLDGKISVEALHGESEVIGDFMTIVDERGSDSAPAAALAAWDALVVALEDEALLEPWCDGVAESDLDSYDWDTAKNAAMAWRHGIWRRQLNCWEWRDTDSRPNISGHFRRSRRRPGLCRRRLLWRVSRSTWAAGINSTPIPRLRREMIRCWVLTQ